jgi:alkanesulfonate monooxygenase SsuD/methylene tetrahydromethanopterin reductase-like flavin-dependent oxidoreductase (luciferase family)
MVVSAAETIDEISGGRFVLGLGAGHGGGGAQEFGYPSDKTVSRYDEALRIIVPLLRGETVTFAGNFHRADGAEVRPRGPRPGEVPLMLGGHSERTMTLAATHADTWSAFATTSSLPAAFEEMTGRLDRICEEVGRDPASIGRSVGVFVEPGDANVVEAMGLGETITGSTDQIAETLAGFADVGVTRVEIVPFPNTSDTLDRVVAAIDAII